MDCFDEVIFICKFFCFKQVVGNGTVENELDIDLYIQTTLYGYQSSHVGWIIMGPLWMGPIAFTWVLFLCVRKFLCLHPLNLKIGPRVLGLCCVC